MENETLTDAAPRRRMLVAAVLVRWGVAVVVLLGSAAAAVAQTAIVTNHNNISRTGWNRTETILTPDSIANPAPSGAFGLLATVPLDGAVDAQPLVVPNVAVSGDPNAGTHDVVYVATQNNTVYAIDPVRGTVLRTRNLGPIVGQERGCEMLDIGVGITGTPVIDLKRNALYVIAYNDDPAGGGAYKQVYRLHMLDLATLQDKLPPVAISAQQTLTNGTTLTFHPAQHRQRAALLEYGNTIYAAFTSFCDNPSARGWMMAWSAQTLQPLEPGAAGVPPTATLTNTQAKAPNGMFLSTLWMSGFGPAADENGLYYVTGNSDPSGTTYDPLYNAEQSMVRLSRDTRAVLDRFTPSNLPYLDQHDQDFGSGGITLIPPVREGYPPMAVAAGKFGTMYLVDRTNMGGYAADGPDRVIATETIGKCWCQASYFSDGWPTIVSDGGNQLMLWKVEFPGGVKLSLRAPAVTLNTSTFGFTTSVSSNQHDNTIVWAVTRPIKSVGPAIYLYAFGVNRPDEPLSPLYVGQAGNWTQQRHVSGSLPVVANGRVYVVSDSGLAIFGLGAADDGVRK